ncbi:hypothetical protein K3Z84_17680, partial [Pseudomonas aeruginosa]|nr:hypothetical protein [Pseudomonas aeruginosa]
MKRWLGVALGCSGLAIALACAGVLLAPADMAASSSSPPPGHLCQLHLRPAQRLRARPAQRRAVQRARPVYPP